MKKVKNQISGFSSQFRTFRAWNRATKDSPYKRRILRRRQFLPRASLKVLRVASLRSVTLAHVSWKQLSGIERSLREDALLVLAQMRKGASLSKAMIEFQIGKRDVLRHLGKFIFKRGGKWVVRGFDRVERARWFYSNGRRVNVMVNDSRVASLISRYLSRVHVALDRNKPSMLQEFKDVRVIDKDGRLYRFELDLDVIREILFREERDFRPIYDDT